MSTQEQFTQALLNAQSHDPNLQIPAEKSLLEYQNSNLAGFLGSLCIEIGDESKPANSRLIAGIFLKNTVTARSQQQKKVLSERWLGQDITLRKQIHEMLLRALPSPTKEIRNVVALAIASIASIEIPNNVWTELPDLLAKAAGTEQQFKYINQAASEALGYLCETMGKSFLESKINDILAAITYGCNSGDHDLILTSLKVLLNALPICEESFHRVDHRDYLMKIITTHCANGQADDIREVSWQCLCEIADLYYDTLDNYIHFIYELSIKALSNVLDSENVLNQVIEFWTTICDREIAIDSELESLDNPTDAENKCLLVNKKFALTALSELCKHLLVYITKQNEDADDDTWGVASAAGVCITKLSEAVKDYIFPHVQPFIANFIKDGNDWRNREAACLVLGCILEGVSLNTMLEFTRQQLPPLVACMHDKSDHVKDTAAWCLGQVCHFAAEVLEVETVPHLINALVIGLKSGRSKTASYSCWAISNFAESCIEVNNTSQLSPYFNTLVQTLLQLSETPYIESNLLVSVYESITQLVKCSPNDINNSVIELFPIIANKLQASINSTPLSVEDAEKQHTIQALLCGSLESIISKLDKNILMVHSDALMQLFITVLQGKSSIVTEEALMAIAEVSRKLEQTFTKYLNHVLPAILQCLTNVQESQLLTTCVGVISSITSAVGMDISAYSDQLVQSLCMLLENADVGRVVKPLIIESLGDIALSINGHFSRYLGPVMNFMKSASEMSITQETMDYDLVDYLITLQQSILNFYIAIINSFGSDNVFKLVAPYLDQIFGYLSRLLTDPELTDDVIRCSVDIIADVASWGMDSIPNIVETIKAYPAIDFVNKAIKSRNKKTIASGKRAKSILYPR